VGNLRFPVDELADILFGRQGRNDAWDARALNVSSGSIDHFAM
jgi:hypothetical protein